MESSISPWDGKSYYRIKVRGAIDPGWSEWFDGLTITVDGNGDSLISGPVADQATLYGLLSRARDLGLVLLSVESIKE